MGIAVCVDFVIGPHLSLHKPPSEIYEATHWIRLYCFVNGSKISDQFDVVALSEQFGKIDSYHLCITYFPLKRKRDKELCEIVIEIKPEGPGLVVMKWGARLVYKQDIEDLKQNMPGSSSCSITPYKDNLDDSAKDTKIKQSCDDSNGDGAGPSGEGTSNEVDRPTSGYIQHPNLIENWIGNLCTQGQGGSNCEEENPSDNGSIDDSARFYL